VAGNGAATELAAALSTEALSGAVMPPFNTDAAIRRTLATRFGVLGARMAG